MVEDWVALIGNMNGAVRDLRQAAPEIMKTFSDMTRAAHGGEALDGKTKELVALAIAVATRCAPCIPYHAEGAVRQGASRAAVAETLAMAYGRRPLCDVRRPGPGGGRSNRGEGSQACVTAAANGRPQLPSRTRITGSCSLKIAVRQETHGVFSRSQRCQALHL